MNDNDFLFILKSDKDKDVIKKLKVKRGCTVPSKLTCPSTNESDGTKVCDDRLNGWLQFPGGEPVCRDPPACGHHTGFICGGSIPPWGAARERSESNIKLPLRAPLLIFPRCYHLKSFPQVDTFLV